jgi:hypothetical protein
MVRKTTRKNDVQVSKSKLCKKKVEKKPNVQVRLFPKKVTYKVSEDAFIIDNHVKFHILKKESLKCSDIAKEIQRSTEGVRNRVKDYLAQLSY